MTDIVVTTGGINDITRRGFDERRKNVGVCSCGDSRNTVDICGFAGSRNYIGIRSCDNRRIDVTDVVKMTVERR